MLSFTTVFRVVDGPQQRIQFRLTVQSQMRFPVHEAHGFHGQPAVGETHPFLF